MNTRVTTVIIIVLIAVIAGLGAAIITAQLGASGLAAVAAGGGAFVGIATVGVAIAAFLIPTAQSQAPPASS
ncbi:hypothetical protein [Streptomyces sp. NPDC051909]|uniref:hypothetical protein n=1 Tax=Streptomyces sp. NPDC051909 TaxID=3154944 RepID=UPI00341EAAD5